MVASAAGGLPLWLQWWIGCMVVVTWMDWCAVEAKNTKVILVANISDESGEILL